MDQVTQARERVERLRVELADARRVLKVAREDERASKFEARAARRVQLERMKLKPTCGVARGLVNSVFSMGGGA